MDNSATAVLRSVYQSQSVARKMLCEQTGLSAGRVNALVSQLLKRGLIREEVRQHGTPGRPAASLILNPDAGRVVGLDIGGTYSRAVVGDLNCRVLASVVHRTQAVPNRTVVLDSIVRLVEEVCQEGGTQPKSLAALGVGVRGIVNTRTGVVHDWPSTPAWAEAWVDLDVPGALRSLTDIQPVFVDDTVRAVGMLAHRCGVAQDSADFLYVLLGTGVGSAVFVDGRPYLGSAGMAGELGHVTVDEEGPWCSCGNRGCLEVMASTPAVLRRVKERLATSPLASALREPYEEDNLTLSALIEATFAGDKLAFQILDKTGMYVGSVLAIAFNLFSPELVVLGGPLAQDGGVILQAVRRQVRLQALQHIWKQARIVCDDYDELYGARGATLVGLEGLFTSPEHLAGLLRSSD